MAESPNRWKLVVASQAALGCYWLALVIGTHVPANVPLVPGHALDKVAHFFGYAILAGLLSTVWQLAGGHLFRRQLVMVWLAVAAYGIVDELTQIPVGRECSVLDWLADVAGAGVGILVFVAMRRWLSSAHD